MKCPECGFIHDGNLPKCPYCGHSFESNDTFLSEQVEISSNVSIKRSSLITIVLFNLFLGVVFLDGILSSFSYGLTLAGYALLFGIVLVVKLIAAKSENPLENYFKVDVYVFGLLLTAYITLGRQFFLGNMRPLLALVVVPIYFILSTSVMMTLLALKKSKLKVLEFVLLVPFRFILSLVLFIFCVIFTRNGVSELTAVFYTTADCYWGNADIINNLGVVLNYVAFGFTGFVTINAAIYAVYRVLKKVNYTYGK